MGFLAPWFLGGLAALGLPVFVHLLRKHVATPRPVSSLMFFERSTQSSTRHRRLRYLLLFALRFALILLVVLAFANPFLRRASAGESGHLLLIVLDHSFSMRAGTRFADAQREALHVLGARPQGTKAQVIALGGEVALLTQPTTDDARLHAALQSIQPGDGHADFGELARAVRSLAETTRSPIDMHLFSDLQRTAMPANFADLVLPQNVKLTLHPATEAPGPPNWTVASVDAPAQVSDPKDPRQTRVQAVIEGFHTPAATKTVALVVNGAVTKTQKVNVPADGRATVTFAPLNVRYGFNRCAVQIEDADAFPADNASIFAVRRSDPQRVLFVHTARDSRSPLYFSAALAAASRGSFVVQSAAAEQATDLDPSHFALIVLSDTLALPTIFEHALAQYVTRGGSVLMALGDDAGSHRQIPIWGSNIKDVRNYAQNGDPASIGQVDFSHPALAQSQPGRDNGGWGEVKFLAADVVDSSNARVAATLGDGTPLILDKQIGEGRVLLFTSGLANFTNDLPLHPVFVQFVDSAARYLSDDMRLSEARLVGSFVQLRSSARPAGLATNVEVVSPDGHRPLSLAEARSAQSFRLQNAGFYQIRFANGQNALVAVNPDRRESDLAPMPADVQRLWSGASGAQTEPSESIAATSSQSHPVSLWRYVMLLALLTAIAETVLASRYMGTQREEL
jgi:hypothetical protein